MGSFFNIFSHKRSSLTILVCFLALAAAISPGLKKFSFDASADTLIDTLDPDYIRTQINAQMFGEQSFIIIAYTPEQEDPFSKTVLKQVLNTEEQLAKLNNVESTLSLASVPIFADINNFEAAIDADNLSWKKKKHSPETLRNVTKSHPIYEDALINKNQDTLGIQVVFSENTALKKVQAQITAIKKTFLTSTLSDEQHDTLNELRHNREQLEAEYASTIYKTLEKIQETLAPLRKTGKLYLGGNRLLSYQLKNIINRDLFIFGLTIFALIVGMLAILFRQVIWVVLPMLTCAMALVITLSTLGIFGFRVTVISANVITLQIILTLSIIIHLIVEYRELLSRDLDKPQYKDMPKHVENTVPKRVSEMVRNKFKPCLFAGLTTGLGFGSLVFSGIQPIISFGWMMMIALSISIVVALGFFPAALSLLKPSNKPPSSPRALHQLLNTCASWVTRKSNMILLAWLALSALSILGIFKLNANNSFINYFRESTTTYRDLAFIDQEFGGSVALDIIFSAPQDSEYAFDQKSLRAIQSITEQLDDLDETGRVSSVADFTRIARVAQGKPLTIYEVNAIYEILPPSIKRQVVKPYFNEESKKHRINVRIKDSSEDFNRTELIDTISHISEEAAWQDNQIQLSNVFLLYEKILVKLVKSQFKTLAIVYGVMFILLTLVFSSLRIAAVALVPNFAATSLLFGVMGVTHTPLDLMTMTIAAVAIGISVDDTIHYIHRYLKEKANATKENTEESSAKATVDAIKASHLGVGYALLYTTLIIVVGFGSLILSDFMPSVYFGFLASVTMLIALLCDLTLLPALLNKFVRKPID